MPKPLPPTFEQIVAKMDRSTFEHERVTAREIAERMAETHGWTFAAALKVTLRTHPRDLPPTREEVRRAEEAEQRKNAKIHAARAARQGEIASMLRLYGSVEKAIAPCWREQRLLDAVARWRVVCTPPNSRWTRELDGSDNGYERTPAVTRALRGAYQMPQTFAEAQTELAYWKSRWNELAILRDMDPKSLYDTPIDIVVVARLDIIKDLACSVLKVETLRDLQLRMQIINSREESGPSRHEWGVLQSDVARLANAAHREHDPEFIHTVASRIMIELRKGDRRSDRAIARAVRCSPTTVGKVRRSMRRRPG